MAATIAPPAPNAAPADTAAPPQAARPGFLVAWAVFWALLLTVELQDHWRSGGRGLWGPLLWWGSSLLVASPVALWQWRRAARFDAQLARPWPWFAANVAPLVVVAPAFVGAVYALRHAVYAMAGQVYQHQPWPEVLRYEVLKFAMFNVLFVAVVFGIRSHAALHQARLGLERERRLAQQAQLLQLAQQLEPHFLFNALNTIASTIHDDPDLADHLLTRLAALLRAATDLTRQPENPLDEELRLLQAYADIMVRRFAGRVQVRVELDPAAQACRVPTLALQPLLENAFRHGVERRPGPCTIIVRVQRHAQRLLLQVEDDAGLLPAEPAWGVGLGTLRQRLQARHGGDARLTLAARPGGGVIASIELPCGC
ncbi:MAG: histidine kinase [Burkholderiales bacterium]|nr:histidine kinase [Burkholderiales bacterium]